MRQHALAQIIHAAPDPDYVESFQILQAINLEIRKAGPTAERLLRKAGAEMDLANYAAGLAAAKDAAVLAPENADAHFHVARAYILLALAKANAIPLGAGLKLLPNESATGLLTKAMDALDAVHELCPEDADATEQAELVGEIVQDSETEAELLTALRHAGA